MLKIYTKKNFFGCRGSTMVLGKWLPREHIGVRHICYRSTMVLGKRLPHEHLGVRHMVWQKDLGKNWTSGRQDAVWCCWGKNFWLVVKRESNLKNKCKSTQNLTPGRVQRIAKKKAVITVFRVTKWWHVLICKCESMIKLNYAEFLWYIDVNRMQI